MSSADTNPVAQAVRWPIILAVVLTAVLEVLDSTIVNVALPHMKGDLRDHE
jgi:DHA2 family multidrug resistance protein